MKHTTPFVSADGTYNIPDDEVDSFKADMPDARPAHKYRADGQTYTIPDDEAEDFAKDMPEAEPVRRLMFSNGTKRDFSVSELRSFLSRGGEFHTSDEFKADRDEIDERAKAKIEEGRKNAPENPEKPDGNIVSDGNMPYLEEDSVKGAKYMAQKGIGPWVKSFLTSIMRLQGKAWQAAPSGTFNYTPSLAAGGSYGMQVDLNDAGKLYEGVSKEIDAFVAPTKEEEQWAKDNGLSIPAEVQEKSQAIASFAVAMHTMGTTAGTTVMSATAGNDTYISLYDQGISMGLPPEEANKYAAGGGAVATLGTAAMCLLPVSRMLRFGTPVLGESVGAGTKVAINNFGDLVRATVNGNIKSALINTGIAAAESGSIMAAQTYGETLMAIGEQGKDIGTMESQSMALWEAAKAGAEGMGIGLLFGGLQFVDFAHQVREGVTSQAYAAASTPEGRAAWREFFPEGTAEVIKKRAKGLDISRKDMWKAGYPEMSAKERNQLADWMLADAESFVENNAARFEAEKEVAKAPKVSPAPYAEEGPAGPKPEAPKPAPAAKPEAERTDVTEGRSTPEKTVKDVGNGEIGKLVEKPVKNRFDGNEHVDAEQSAPAEKPDKPAVSQTETPTTSIENKPTKKVVDTGFTEEALEYGRVEAITTVSDISGAKYDESGNQIPGEWVKRPKMLDAKDPEIMEEINRIIDAPTEEKYRERLSQFPFSQEAAAWIRNERMLRHPETAENAPASSPRVEDASTRPESEEGGMDYLSRLADNPDELDAIFNEALAEKEEESSPKPVVKTVNKGRGPVKAEVNPEATEAAPAAPKNMGKKPSAEARRSRETAAISKDFGAGSEEAVSALYDIFGASKDAASRANVEEMAIGADDKFDENLYNTVKPHFQKLRDSFPDTRAGVVDFLKAVAKNFGPGARQYLHRFVNEISTQQRGNENGSESSAGNRDGVPSGRDETSGHGNGASGEPAPAAAAGESGAGAGDSGTEHGVPAGLQDGQGGGGRDGIRSDGAMAGHGTDLGGVRPASGAVGNGLATKDAGAGDNAGKPSVVRAPNGNLDTRNSPPVRLSKGERIRINALVEEIVKKDPKDLTDEDVETLRQFTGAGGLGYRGKGTATQIAALNQHFTDYTVVDAMWRALEKAKVPMQKVCEPGAGSGNFPGRRPELDWTLCELDPLAAKVLQRLFPGAKVLAGTFEDMKLDPHDLFISNVPFLEQRNHPNRPDIKSLHDFYFVHSLEQTEPNGVVAFITSTGTMDKMNPAVRRELMESGDIIGAFRLPQGTFAANAGTDVTTDVIFIQKRPDGVAARPENLAANEAFVNTVEYPGGSGERPLRINGYYEQHPEGILGDLTVGKDKLHGGKEKLNVLRSDATDLSQISVNYKPYPVAAASGSGSSSGSAGNAGKGGSASGSSEKPKYPHTVEGLDAAGVKYELSDGNGTYSQNIRMYDGVPHVRADEFTLDGYEEGTHTAKVFVPVEGENAGKIAALQHIVDDATAFQNGDADAAARGEAEIADYQKRYGVHPNKDRALRKFFKDNDEQIYFKELAATFDEDFKPAESFRKRVRFEGSGKKQADENSSLIDQALASEDAAGEIHLDDSRCKIAESDIGDLLQSGYSISADGNDGRPVLQNNIVFESGNIYRKIAAQKKLKESLPSYAAVIDRQISRLESILPVRKVFDAIPFKGVEGWTDESNGWIAPVLQSAGINIFRSFSDSGMAEYRVNTSGGLLTDEECEILGKYLAGRQLLTKGQDEAPAAFLAREREAEGMLTDIYAKIRARVAEDPGRVANIERAYNELYNGYVKPDYTKAQYLIADTVKAFADAGINLRENQKRWVTQALIEGVGINAHDVGGGKTLAAMALAHALKARGVCQKPMFVVPAKTIKTSWLNSHNGMQKLFPNARIINLGELPAAKRTEMLFDLANSTADAVFISHEGFEAIQLPPEVEAKALRDFTDSLVDSTGDRQEAKKRESLEAYIRSVEESKRDTRLTLDKLGVDCLIVDEAHNYKNTGVSSRLEGVGLGKSFAPKRDKNTGKVSITSARSHDFRFKTDFITERNNGRNVFLLTATPTPNKPIEIYTMLRHLGQRVLGDYGIFTDRDFASKFFETGMRACISSTGGEKNKNILCKIKDVFALKDIMTRYVDRIPMEAFLSQGIKLPEVSYETKFVDMSHDMEMVQDEINDRVADAASTFNKREGDDTVIGVFMSGRDAAVTPYVYGGPHARLHVEDRSHDPATDKIELAIQETVHEINLGKQEGKPRTVIIFSDVQGGRDGSMSIPEDIKQTLISRGMDPKEIAIVTGSVCTNPETGKEVQASGKKGQELKGKIQELFSPKADNGERPADPKIKVVIGSTASIGEGLNLNTWTSLSINLDVPMTPGAFKQREGRMVRQGNQHEKVRSVNLVTRGSFDTLSLSIVSRKQGWNQALWNAEVREEINVEDEMSSNGIDPNEIIIESLRDPIEKIHCRVDYDLSKVATEIEQARNQVNSVDGRIATQRRNITDAQTRIDSHRTSIAKLRQEAKDIEASLPKLEKDAESAYKDLADFAGRTGETDRAEKLKVLVENVQKAREMLIEKENAYDEADQEYHKLRVSFGNVIMAGLNTYNPETEIGKAWIKRNKAEVAIEHAKKDIGAAKDAVSDLIKTFKDEDGRAFARVYSNASATLTSARINSGKVLESVPYHEGIVDNAKRDIEASNARIAELDESRGKAELAWRQAIERRNALGNEWYDDFGGEHPTFKLEKATLQAEMDEANKKEDEAEEWMGTKQMIEDMPAPASTGSKPLSNGKLPGVDAFHASGKTRTDKTTNRTQIFEAARKLFPELRITNKGTHRRRALGWLEVDNRVIRTVDPLAIPVLAHELGHAVMSLAGEAMSRIPRLARTEFISLGTDLYGSKTPNGGYAGEGIAEFIRGFLCDYDLAKDFPNAHKWFFEDFGDRNPEFTERLFALKGKILEYASMTPEQKIRGMWDHKTPVAPSEIPFIQRMLNKDWMSGWVDSNWPLMRVVRSSGVDFNFHNPNLTPAERDAMILNHPYMLGTFFQGKALRFAETDALDCTTDLYGEKTGDSLQQILEPIAKLGKENLKEFWDYAVAMRGADYAKKGLEFGATRGEIAATIAKYRSRPGFRDTLKAVTDWSHRILHLLVEGGAITPEEYQKICDANPFYIPIHRVFTEIAIDGGRHKAGKKGVFHRKGGSQDIDAPATALIEMAARVRQAAMQAKIVNSLVDMYDRAKADKSKTINKFMVEMPNPVKINKMWSERVKKQIAQIASARFGTDAATIRNAMKDTWTEELFSFSAKAYNGSQPNIVSIHDRTGKLRTFEVVDPGIIEVLKGYSNPEKLSGFEKLGAFVANGIRLGATVLKGSFSLVSNPIRDTQTSFHMEEYGMQIPGVSTIEGMVNSVLNTDLAKAYLRLGGDMGSFFQDSLHASSKSIAAVAQETNPVLRELKKGLFTMIGNLFSIPEIGTRIMAFRNAKNYWLGQGVSTRAANLIGRLCGGDITIDFGRAGKDARKWNRIVLFFNAAVRELDQLARASGIARQLPWQNPGDVDWSKVDGGADMDDREKEFYKQARRNHAKRFWGRGAALMSFALLSWLLNRANEEKYRKYKELKPEYKWNNVTFGDVRLPVPFLDGLLFQSLPVALLESVEDGDSLPVREVCAEMAKQLPVTVDGWHQILRNMSAVSPEIDILANQTWNDSAIVPERMQKLDPRDWQNQNTTAFARTFGGIMADMLPENWKSTRKMFAPAYIDYFIDQHTGGLLGGLMRDFEAVTSKRGAIGVNGDYTRIPVVGRLFLSPFSSSRLPGDFYNELDTLNAKHQSGRLDAEGLGRLRVMEEVQEKYLKEFSAARREILTQDIDAKRQKELIDNCSRSIIETIRNFNDNSKNLDFRGRGIEAAAIALSNPAVAESTAPSYRNVLMDVGYGDASNALRRYGYRKGWGKDTLNRRLLNLFNNMQ